MIAKLERECKRILVLEEGAPVIEEALKGLLSKNLNISGRLDGAIPRDGGELNPNIVALALGKPDTRILICRLSWLAVRLHYVPDALTLTHTTL